MLDRIGTSFFFSNFTEDWTRESTWKHFQRFGIVLDIFIPYKRSKFGKLFRFVKYKDVTDVAALLNKICLVAMGADRLFIQEAKFRRQSGEVSSRLTQGRHMPRSTIPKVTSVGNNQRSNSQAGRFRDHSAWPALGRVERKTLEVGCSARREEIKWLKRCAIGEVMRFPQVGRSPPT